MVALRTLFLAGFLLLEPVAANALTVYPENPNLNGNAIFLSLEGVVRLDHQTLEPQWVALEGVETDSPVIIGTTVIVGSAIGLFALASSSGDILWHLPSAVTLYSPAVADGVAYAGGKDGVLRAVKVANGEEVWQRQFSGAVFSPTLVNGTLVTGDETETLRGINAKNGQDDWERRLTRNLVFQPVADERGSVFVATADAKVIAIDPRNGNVRWENQFESPATVACDETRLYLGHFNGVVTAHDIDSGKQLWEHKLGGTSRVPIKVVMDRVIATTDQGEAILLDSQSGERVMEEESKTPPSGHPPVEVDEDSIVAAATQGEY